MDDWTNAGELIAGGGIGVLPTDTLYGLVGSALSPDAVERIYQLKQRSSSKPLIVLVSEIDQLEQFGIILTEGLRSTIAKYWPGPYSIILDTLDDQFDYLHRGTGSIAFRIPDKEELLNLLNATGPIVAPSANVEGERPAETISAAKKYFGTDVDFYVDGGMLTGKPSTIIQINDEGVSTIRD
jgi:L-threonylcarbamoyladenylate synthase